MVKKKNKNQEQKNNKEELTELISDTINKTISDSSGKVSYFLDQEGPVNIADWVSSGSSLLDIAMSNIPNGGFPVGRIIEITGLEASGKSLLASHSLANTQKKGGVSVYIDVEQSVSKEFLTAIGVDISKLVYANIQTVEDIFDVIMKIINKVKTENPDKLVTIVIDSVAAATTHLELSSDFTKSGYDTDKSIIISKAMRKITDIIAKEKVCLIFTNQLRMKMNSLGDPYTTSGGKAIAFHASIRLRLKSIGKIKDSKDRVIGINTKVETIKNRIAPPFQQAIFGIYFDRGIDDYESWLSPMVEYNIATKAAAWYTFLNEETGEEIKFQKKDFYEKVLSDENNKQYIYDKLAHNLVHKYKIPASDEKNDITNDSEK